MYKPSPSSIKGQGFQKLKVNSKMKFESEGALIESGDGGVDDWRCEGGAADPVLGSTRSVDWVTILTNQLRLASFAAVVAAYGGRIGSDLELCVCVCLTVCVLFVWIWVCLCTSVSSGLVA